MKKVQDLKNKKQKNQKLHQSSTGNCRSKKKKIKSLLDGLNGRVDMPENGTGEQRVD